MNSSFDPGALLARSYALPRGPRVCLRLARVRDLPSIQALLEGQQCVLDELELQRLVRANPRERIAICAAALIGSAETIVGFGAVDVAEGSEPALVIADETLTRGLEQLLTDALVGRAQALTHARAAGSPLGANRVSSLAA